MASPVLLLLINGRARANDYLKMALLFEPTIFLLIFERLFLRLKSKMRNSIENGKCLDAVSLEIVHLVSRTFHTRIPVLLWSRLRMERTCVILCKMARECIQLHAWSIVTMSRESWRNADLQLRYELLWTVHCSFESPCTWN